MSGAAVLEDPRVRVGFPGALAGRERCDLAEVDVAVTCRNLSSARVTVQLRASFTRKAENGEHGGHGGNGSGGSVSGGPEWSKTIELDANASAEEVALGSQPVVNPALWYPVGYGSQPLYEMQVTATVVKQHGRRKTSSAAASAAAAASHQVTTSFGFRQLESRIEPRTKSRTFTVNGVPIFIRGANYIVPDFLLRCSDRRCRQEVRYHAEMGLNMIRLWGGAGVPYESFYSACDEFGVLGKDGHAHSLSLGQEFSLYGIA